VIIPGTCRECDTGVGAAETEESIALGRAKNPREMGQSAWLKRLDCDGTPKEMLSQAVERA